MAQTRTTIRDLGYGPGYYRPGLKNSILDIPGLQVGFNTIHDEERGIHVGVTIVFPRGVQDTRKKPCYAAIHTLNGAGEMTGKHFIDEWGFTNSPIAFTDSMSIGAVYQSLIAYAWETSRSLGEDAEVGYAHSGFPVVGETWGGGVTDIHDFKSTLKHEEVLEAIKDGETRDFVPEGGSGGGAGMLCQGHKGGTGTSSRLVPSFSGDTQDPVATKPYTVAALVQTNYGQKMTLQINGIPIGKLLIRSELEEAEKTDGENQSKEGSATSNRQEAKQETLPMHGTEGSILVSLYTDAPLLPHQLRRMAQRATMGLVIVGGHGTSHNTSGDIFIALSTSETSVPEVLMKKEWDRPSPKDQAYMGGRVDDTNAAVVSDINDETRPSGNGFRRLVETQTVETVVHSTIDALFVAAQECTEEAILNSMVGAADTVGFDGTVWRALDKEKVKGLLERYKTW